MDDTDGVRCGCGCGCAHGIGGSVMLFEWQLDTSVI